MRGAGSFELRSDYRNIDATRTKPIPRDGGSGGAGGGDQEGA